MPNGNAIANEVTSWTDRAQAYSSTAQAIFAFITIVVGIFGFAFVVRQIRQVERSIRGETLQGLFSQWGEVTITSA